MTKIINKLNQFNYTKAGVATGLILGIIMTSMGVSFIINSISKKEKFLIFGAIIVLGLGISAIVVELYRLRKLRKGSQKI